MNKDPRGKDLAIAVLLAGLFLLIVALVSFESPPTEPVPVVQSSAPVNTMELVNKHLRDVYDSQEMNRENVERINAITAPPIAESEEESVEPGLIFNQLPLDFDSGEMSSFEGQDLNAMALTAVQQRPLSQQIQHEILEDLRRAKEEAQYKKALAGAIIAKAKSQGYDVQIDENFKVRSVRKIEIKDAPSIFDPKSLPNR
ncbi:MAG: hypothetical protein RJB66_2247 [Pseudomonadota bacterium]|jgi:hypothetical protein